MFERCGELGIAVTVFEPLASGILTGRTVGRVIAIWTGPWVDSPFYKRLLGGGNAAHSFAVADGLRPIAERTAQRSRRSPSRGCFTSAACRRRIAGSRNARHVAANAGRSRARPDGVARRDRRADPARPGLPAGACVVGLRQGSLSPATRV